MPKVKIISNPYEKKIKYQEINGRGEWIDIDYSTHKTSKLLGKDMIDSFFPFKVKDIVDRIVQDYQVDDEKIEIYFEGSMDEYEELKSVCTDCDYEVKVEPVLSGKYLENARDILPEVVKLYKEMSPLILNIVNHEVIKRDLDRFTDASNDVVPICVLGNYSSGKSTFINALIGSEILPSGINPVTSMIFKICRSKHKDRASIRFEYMGKPVILSFTEHSSSVPQENELAEKLKHEIEELNDMPIAVRVNKAICIINEYPTDEGSTDLSDIIEIEIPFVKGVLAESQHPFVIFDTPGSNSASNSHHLEVLKHAMKSMTNGLPIFIATPESLDSTDNENLYNIISELKELDSRFTMIIANKADKNDLNRKGSSSKEEQGILRQSVPRNLYSGGIFYVSSILGLGSKNDGDFFDDFCAETFEDQQIKYCDPSNRRYKTLYVYNILPAQIKSRSVSSAKDQQNLIYANSGLFCIEKEIETFAGKHSAYNKCFQAQMFLNNIIQKTEVEIINLRNNFEDIKADIQNNFENGKTELINKIDITTSENQAIYISSYSPTVVNVIKKVLPEYSVSLDDLQEKERGFTRAREQEMGYGSKKTESISFDAGDLELKEEFSSEKKRKTLRKTSQEWQDRISQNREDRAAQNELRKQIDKLVSDDILEYIKTTYKENSLKIYNFIETKSKEFWTEKADELRETLIKVVTGDNILLVEDKDELNKLIIEYQGIGFDEEKADDIFNKEDMEKKFSAFGKILWRSNHLNLDKLSNTYSTDFGNQVTEWYNEIKERHKASSCEWIENLVSDIKENIVQYNPELTRQSDQIQAMTSQIDDIVSRQKKISKYKDELCAMMDWKYAK